MFFLTQTLTFVIIVLIVNPCLHLSQEQMMSKLQRLSYLAQNDLKPTWDRVSAIDLRYRNGLAIQWKNSVAPHIANGHFVVTISDKSIAGEVTAKP